MPTSIDLPGSKLSGQTVRYRFPNHGFYPVESGQSDKWSKRNSRTLFIAIL